MPRRPEPAGGGQRVGGGDEEGEVRAARTRRLRREADGGVRSLVAQRAEAAKWQTETERT